MARLIFLDTETTGLNPETHEIWEVGCIIRDDNDPTTDREKRWFLPVDLRKADLIALNIGKFQERYKVSETVPHRKFINEFMYLSWGATIIGAIPSFDCERIARLMYKHGGTPTWHYHLIDIESMAFGFLKAQGIKIDVPFKFEELLLNFFTSTTILNYEKHTALGDARLVRDLWDNLNG